MENITKDLLIYAEDYATSKATITATKKYMMNTQFPSMDIVAHLLGFGIEYEKKENK